MPIFEVEQDGVVYEVDAPDIQQAAAAAQAFKPAAPQSPQDQLHTLADAVPTASNQAQIAALEKSAPPPAAVEEPGLFDRAMKAARGDPIIDMWLSSLSTAAKGAPEVLANTVGNAGVAATAGITAPFVSDSPDDAANYVRDFTSENTSNVGADFGNGMSPEAEELTSALGEAFQPLENIKRKLGETTLNLTGSPDAAATMDMAPDFLATVFGAPKVTQGARDLPNKPLRADPAPVNETVENLRAADLRLRPSDVRAMDPKAKKIPGERREKFADAPDLKKDTTLHNQGRMSDLAAEELGIKTLDETSFNTAREAPAATYDMVENVLRDRDMSPAFVSTFREAAESAKLPKGEQYTVTRLLGALRRRAAKRMQSDDVKTEEAGFADRELADRLEEGLGNELNAAGEPQLFKEYTDARQQFAKIHDVETATRANQVDASMLFKMKQRGVKLSGRLKLIADAFESAPNVTSHSLKTAARAGDEVPGSREGIVKGLLKAGIRKIPGMDVGAEGFQNTLGRPDPTRVANYGRSTDIPGPRAPDQAELDIREALGLEMSPGAVGKPNRTPRDLGPQEDMLGSAFEMNTPGGNVGIPPDPQMTLQDLLGLGEPLNLKKAPGRVGKKPRGG